MPHMTEHQCAISCNNARRDMLLGEITEDECAAILDTNAPEMSGNQISLYLDFLEVRKHRKPRGPKICR